MMKGNNTIELNIATMEIAIQFWLESQFAEGKCPIVNGVSYRSTGGSGVFMISLTDKILAV